MQTKNLRSQAIEIYERSELRTQNERKRVLEAAALQQVLDDLGLDEIASGSIIKSGDIILTAHYRETRESVPNLLHRAVPDPDDKYALESVSIQAHVRCDLCGEMRHSEKLRPRRIALPKKDYSSSFPANSTLGMVAKISSFSQDLHPSAEVSVAIQIGEWLTEQHDCLPSDNRTMGFRASMNAKQGRDADALTARDEG